MFMEGIHAKIEVLFSFPIQFNNRGKPFSSIHAIHTVVGKLILSDCNGTFLSYIVRQIQQH